MDVIIYILIVLMCLCAFVVLAFYVFLYVIYRLIFFNNLKKKDLTFEVLKGKGYDEYHDKMIDIIKVGCSFEYEDVKVMSYDKKTLHAKYYFVSEDAHTVIAFHGYKGDPIRDLSGGLTYALKRGFNVLLVDHRGHVKSDGRTISFGIKERRDVITWIDYINEYRNKKKKSIILLGISMGASTILMASNLITSKNVKGIIADCPYASAKDEICHVIDKMKLSSKFLSPFVSLSASIYGRFDIDEVDAIRAIKENDIPILLIHGIEDDFVPYQNAQILLDARKNKSIKLASFEKAVHGMSYICDSDKYEEVCDKFIKEVL